MSRDEMIVRREELSDELVILFGASRELTPDTDRHLAEMFLDRLERRPLLAPPRPSFLDRLRDPRKVAAAVLLGSLALAAGAPLAFHGDQRWDRDMQPAPVACSQFACWSVPDGQAPWFDRHGPGMAHREDWYGPRDGSG